MMRKKSLIIIIALMTAGLLTWGGIQWGILLFCSPQPVRAGLDPVMISALKNNSPVESKQIGDCYQFERNGLKACYLDGDPAVRGLAYYIFYKQEDRMMAEAVRQMEYGVLGNNLEVYLMDRKWWLENESWQQQVSDEVAMELSGYAAAKAGRGWKRRLYYNELLTWQTAYDRLKEDRHGSWISGLAFGLTGRWMGGDRIILARNFDFKEAVKVESLKTVVMVKPSKGYRFLSVAWPGQAGVISAMNEKGLGISLVSAVSDGHEPGGYPAALLARDVMQHAGTVKEAVAIIKNKPIVSAETFIVGSGAENRFVAVEKDSMRCVVRQMKFGVITAGNYLRSPVFQKDQAVINNKQLTASKEKVTRLKELLYIHRNNLSVSRIASILRDKRTLYGRQLSIGHPFAINSLTTVHSVIFDLKNKIAWVGGSPFNLGAFTAFSFEHFDKTLPSLDTAADAMLGRGHYKTYMVYQLGLREAARLFERASYQDALAWIQEMRPLNPNDYKLYLLAGKALAKLNREDEALYNLHKAMRLQPGFASEIQEITSLIAMLKKTQ